MTGSSGLDSATEALILSDRQHRAQKRMWAALNLEFFRDRLDLTEQETDQLSDMLGLSEETSQIRQERETGEMAKNGPDHTIGNVDPNRRGRDKAPGGDPDKEGERTIGQKIPKRVRDEINPKEK